MRKINKRFFQIYIILKFCIAKILFLFSKKYYNVWLISERGDEAKDNGYVFFEYLLKNHPDINTYYVISKKSKDVNRISDKSKIVNYQSFKHILMYINAEYLISTHLMGFSPEFHCFTKLEKKFAFFKGRGKKIFLQHGIIYNYLPALKNEKLDLFITSAEKEKEFICNEFNFSNKVVKCTGLARYDNLIGKSKNFILVMPTWRQNLYYMNNTEFMNTPYYKNWNLLLNDKHINEILEKNNLKLFFYPHYEMQRFLNCFDIKSSNVFLIDSQKYQISDMLRECKIFITDYSSTFFDVAYMKKPVIFYQFDYNDFYKQHYQRGYLDLKTANFGYRGTKCKEIISYLDNICKRKYKIEDIQKKTIDSFYKYHDQNNCDRIYKEIKKLKGVK